MLSDNVLWLTLDIVPGLVCSTVTVDRALGVELLEALHVSSATTITPDCTTLNVEVWTKATEAEAVVVGARFPVLLVNIRRTLARITGTYLRQIALVCRFTTNVTTWT